ncbi:MAG: hypothetical protein IKD85_02650 [Firmicutes bacterium]|nr:hypothetical protein [Bacillota bacterium]
MQDFLRYVNWEIKEQKNRRQRCLKMIKKLPQGTLACDTDRGGRIQYRMLKDGKRKRIRASDPLLEKLKERKLCEDVIRKTDENIQMLEKIKKNYQNTDLVDCHQQLPKAYQGIEDSFFKELGVLTEAEFRRIFQTDPAYRLEQRVHTLSSGGKVRSRVEMTIAERYLARGLVFTYEPCLILHDKTVIHPDFAILVKSTNRVMLHEHVGDLNKEEYRKYFVWKMEQYIKNGYLPMRDIIFTYENEKGSVDVFEIDRLIDCFLI